MHWIFQDADENADILAIRDAAQRRGDTLFSLPPTLNPTPTLQAALALIPCSPSPEWIFWKGFVPTPQQYEALYNALKQKNLYLLNTPQAHQQLLEFDLAYPYLLGLTPTTLTATSPDEAIDAAQDIGYPVFIRGASRSLKAQGRRECIAENDSDTRRITNALLSNPIASRGRVLIRELVSLRQYGDHDPHWLPVTREFRVFVAWDAIVGLGAYWLDLSDNPWCFLNDSERHIVVKLALGCARLLQEAHWVCVDIGQRNDGAWTIIEVNDPQCSGLSAINPATLVEALAFRISQTPPPLLRSQTLS